MRILSRPAIVLSAMGIVTLAGMAPPTAEACMRIPPPPRCAKTLVLTKAAPPAIFVPAGVAPAFAIPYTVFWNMTNVGLPNLCPPPSGPGGTFPATITMNVVCVGGPGLPAPVVTPVNLNIGFNPGAIPVVLPAGPPRFCTIVGNVTLTLLDGMVLGANGDSVVCIVEPSPADPSLPRLDLQNLDPAIQRVHPGDQSLFRYELTNNDPNELVTVTLDADLENVSGLPDMLGPPGPPGTGLYSVADPGGGDNFPIAFDPGLPASGCVYLPGEHGNTALSTARQRQVVIPPETTVEVALHARAWGLCANGSCGEGRILVEGEFDGGDPALACTGFSHIVDTSVPPAYEWPGSGRVVKLNPLDPSIALALQGVPLPGLPQQVDNVQFPQNAAVDDQPVFPNKPQLQLFEDINNEAARYTYNLPLDNPAFLGSEGLFQWSTQYFTPVIVDQLQLGQIHPGAPNGFETLAPGAIVDLHYNSFGPPTQTVFEIMYQVSGQARNSATNETVPIEIIELNLQSVNPVQINGNMDFLVGLGPEGGFGGPYDNIDIFVDVRGFSRGLSDADLDGLLDDADNCPADQNGPVVADPGGNVQLDTDGDGIGNLCDPDIAPASNDCQVNFLDLQALKNALFSTPIDMEWNPDADLNGDGIVNFGDAQIMEAVFFGPPGPSGVPNICGV